MSNIMNTSSNSVCSTSDMEPPRKKRFRAKLDHMSPEEKQERRKAKNRQAAQTARDRKRMNTERLQEENRILREENMRLRNQILGNGQQLSAMPRRDVAHSPINDSGISEDLDSQSTSITYLSVSDSKFDLLHGSPANRTVSPDSTYYGAATMSPAPSDDKLIDTIIERDNDIALVNDIQKLVKYVEGGVADESPLESAALICVPQQQVRTSSAAPPPTVNSLGWTSIQLMLILMISRIHHRLSMKIRCCRREPMKLSEHDDMDPVNCNLYDYILHTKCMDFRRAAEAIITNKDHVRQQCLVTLDFVHKYLYNMNLSRNPQPQQQNNQQQPQQKQSRDSDSISIQKGGCLVKVQQ